MQTWCRKITRVFANFEITNKGLCKHGAKITRVFANFVKKITRVCANMVVQKDNEGFCKQCKKY